MIYGTHYQTLITDQDLVNGGVSALRTLKVGQVAIINEDDETNAISSWNDVKKFSLYEAVRDENGKQKLMKHSGAKPISVPHIRIKTYNIAKHAVPQYWQIVLKDTFAPCCKDYTVKFMLQSEQIQKSQFPNYYVQEISVKKECCEEACGGEPNPFTNDELAFMLWYEVMLNKEDYLKANIMIPGAGGAYDTPITAHDKDGNAYFTYDGSDYRNISFRGGKVYYDGGEADSISDFFDTLNLPGDTASFAIVFEIDSELELRSGNINLKYDYLRNVRADMTLEGGFKCADGIDIANNDVVDNLNPIIFDEGGNAVAEFSYPVGSGYDVRQMEQYDRRRTVNSPYPFSNFAHTETGMANSLLSKEDHMYNMLTIEYQQHSDALGGEFPHPHGTTICLDAGGEEECTEKYILIVVRKNGNQEITMYAVVDSVPANGADISDMNFVDSDSNAIDWEDFPADSDLWIKDMDTAIKLTVCTSGEFEYTNWVSFLKMVGVQ